MMNLLAFSLILLATAGGFNMSPTRRAVNGFEINQHNKVSTELTYTSTISPSLSSSLSSTDLGMVSITTRSAYHLGGDYPHLINGHEVDDDNDETLFNDESSSSISSSYMGPPVGAMYESKLRFPVLGTQSFSLQIHSRTHAHLKVDGKLKFNEPVQYSFNQNDGKLTFALSEQLKLQLRRYFTSLQEVGYDFKTDTPYVKVLPPLPAAIKIFLKRVHQ
jgi:hypothetical protein